MDNALSERIADLVNRLADTQRQLDEAEAVIDKLFDGYIDSSFEMAKAYRRK